MAAEYHPIRSGMPDKANCIQAAVVKNQDPAKHKRLGRPAPVVAGSPGIVAIANSEEPIANSQHCRRRVATVRLEV